MRIKKVRIQNFRSFDDVTVEFNNYTCLVGPNGAGKSSVLCALNVFFRETRDAKTNLLQLNEQDFHLKNTSKPVVITVTFSELSAEAQKDFQHYFRNGELVVSAIAEFNPQAGYAEVVQHGERMVMQEFTPFFEADSKKALVPELKAIYEGIRNAFPDLPPPGIKAAMVSNLQAYETAHPERCILKPSASDFYGFSKGTNLLRKYVEWIYVAAVKDVTGEQAEAKNNALGRLVARAVHSKVSFDESLKQIRETANADYEKMLKANAAALEGLSKALQTRVAKWAHPEARVELTWDRDAQNTVSIKDPSVRIQAGEGSFSGDLSRFGHGLQRSYLLALLQELSEAGVSGPLMILACEEPELYQHPPQARHLAAVLAELSQQEAQIMVSTHSPTFVAGEMFEDVRAVRKDSATGKSTVTSAQYQKVAERLAKATGKTCKKPEGIAAILHRTLQRDLNEMFFAARIVLVEGMEDAAYLSSYLHLLGRYEDFRRQGQYIVATHGKSEMLEPLLVSLELGLSILTIFDADGEEKKAEWKSMHERENSALLRALGVDKPVPFPQSTVWGTGFVQWPNRLSDLVAAEMGTVWTDCSQLADAEWGHAGGLRKNPLHVGTSLRLAWEKGARSATLEKLCGLILS